MDARERLRRYLEQRRELGESELVLDGMTVDDVLGVLGAARAPGVPIAKPSAPMRPLGGDAPPPPAGDAPAPADHPRLRGEGEPGVQALPPQRAVEPEMTDRGAVAPEVPQESIERGDWRATLRATGAAQPIPDEAAPKAEPAPATVRAGQLYPGTDVPIGVVAEGTGDLLAGPMDHLRDLDEIARTVLGCTRCPLYKTATHGVPGEGNPDADFVVVGEAPGADEDASGRPFVGASGQLLTKILAAIKLAREDVFICNVVKHRPPGNRNPTPDEVEACSPYLVRQLELVRPKVILTVGNFAAQTLLGTKLGIGKLRGQVHLYRGVPLIATYHPAALLRNPAWKRPTWEDVQLARRILDRASAAR
ncbi:uracil-DNA glycosylase [Roseisolibacter sp. H3M3-2]|uniref:uracil-DNA glycosylase n=1 Tax=Roseisolibacter sp. H3M3-2 TaxID=3031323 RepID=UPI0023D9B329|nr:uracil-DNA glycosylase [Roseisolibacter sp. H3M3-2]MDF1501497.1 uracil-DNA glycosylase [Roseisolibacter sp. H3M3-2]